MQPPEFHSHNIIYLQLMIREISYAFVIQITSFFQGPSTPSEAVDSVADLER